VARTVKDSSINGIFATKSLPESVLPSSTPAPVNLTKKAISQTSGLLGTG